MLSTILNPMLMQISQHLLILSAMQRINGRAAMWAFLICSIQELTSGQSVTQQAAAHPIAATFLGLILSVASLAPKYVSGVSLSELLDAASREGLPQALRFFNKTHELWLGRVAMIGWATSASHTIGQHTRLILDGSWLDVCASSSTE